MTLPLSDIVNVSINVGPVAAVRTSFNVGLIVGTSTKISAIDRVKTYSKIGGLTEDGWLGTEPEYLAAQIYFSQLPAPTLVVIGKWNNQATVPIATPTVPPTLTASGTGGGLAAGTYFVAYSWLNTNYVTGKQETEFSPIASITVTTGQTITATIPSLGANANLANVYIGTTTGQANMKLQGVTAITAFTQSLDLNTTSVLSPLTNTTSGITIAAETAVQAVTACRQANSEWYACMLCNATKADIIAVAAYIDSASPVSTHFYTTKDADVLLGIAGNIMDTLQKSSAHRTLGQYSTSKYASNIESDSADSVAAIMGFAMGSNTQTAGSAYTLAYKTEIGITAEPLTEGQSKIIKNYNGNIYVNRGTVYNVFENGKMADGTYFDEILNLDILANNIQAAVMNTFIDLPKVPQTDPGMATLLNAITASLETARGTGFIAEGIWNAAPILTVNTGDVLTRGYAILAGTIASQSQADRDNRISPPIYILIKSAGAIQNVAIGLYINR